MNKLVEMINWVNDTDPAINATHLNQKERELNALDDRVIGMVNDVEERAVRAETAATDASNYSSAALISAEEAEEALNGATEGALRAEGYSLGTQNKQPVGPDSEYYQNNAKYYKEQAKELVGNYIPDPEEKEVGNTLIYDGSGWVAAEIELGTTLVETLATGETEVVFTSDKITEDSTIDFYTSVFGVNPINAEVVNHTITLTFEAQPNDVDVKVVVK